MRCWGWSSEQDRSLYLRSLQPYSGKKKKKYSKQVNEGINKIISGSDKHWEDNKMG